MAAGTRTDIVFLTALGLEHDAVRAHLTAASPHIDPDGTHYTVGELTGDGPRIGLALVGEGNLSAAVLTARPLQELRPQALILVGVAGALSEEAAVGDVVVATRIHTYQGGREESQTFRPRVRSWPVAHGLEQAARDVAQSGTWLAAPADNIDTATPRVHFKPIVSGDVVLDSRTSPLARLIAHHYSDAIAIDMESAGFAEAAHRHSFHQAIAVRGISDAADGHKRHSDARGSQHRAAAHAAAFAAALARRLAATRPDRSNAPERPPRTTPIATGSPPSPTHRQAGAAIRQHLRPTFLLSAALAAAVSALIYAGATALLRDKTGAGTREQTTAEPSNSDIATPQTPAPATVSGAPPTTTTPSAGPPGPGWVVIRQGRDIELAVDQEIDLDTGDISIVDEVATGPDLLLRGGPIAYT